MSKYKIKIKYTTGNSFGRHDQEDYIDDDLVWEDIDIVKKNVEAIREHEEMYEKLEYGRCFDKKSILDKYKDKDWYVEESDKTLMELNYHSIKIYLDNGNFMKISPFWQGYFETLNEVEVEDITCSSLSFKIN